MDRAPSDRLLSPMLQTLRGHTTQSVNRQFIDTLTGVCSEKGRKEGRVRNREAESSLFIRHLKACHASMI